MSWVKLDDGYDEHPKVQLAGEDAGQCGLVEDPAQAGPHRDPDRREVVGRRLVGHVVRT